MGGVWRTSNGLLGDSPGMPGAGKEWWIRAGVGAGSAVVVRGMAGGRRRVVEIAEPAAGQEFGGGAELSAVRVELDAGDGELGGTDGACADRAAGGGEGTKSGGSWEADRDGRS